MYDIQQYDLRVNDNGIPYLSKGKRLFSSHKNCACPDDFYSIMKDAFEADKLAEEYVWALALDSKNAVKAIFEVSHGDMKQTIASTNSVMVRMLLAGAVKMCLIHNHPSGNTEPSNEDIKVTKLMIEAAKICDVQMLDHIIIGRSGFTSLMETGVIA